MTNPAATPAPSGPDRDALKARAKELGVEHDGNVPTAKLAEMVAAAEANAAAPEPAPAAPGAGVTTSADVATPAAPSAPDEPTTVEVTKPGKDATPVEAPTAADVVAAAQAEADLTERTVDSIEVTGAQSAIIRGTEAGVAAIIRRLREHGGMVTTDDGATILGPITGRSIEDGGQLARIVVAFPIEHAEA